MKKIISYLFPFALMFMLLYVMGETNYNACKAAINQAENKISDKLSIYEVYGFKPNGNPFYKPTAGDKIRAVFAQR
jgi:hypothetical protein